MSTSMTASPAAASSPSCWEMEVRRPGPQLRGIVGELAAFREVSATPVRRRELPAPRIVMIVNLGAPLRMAKPGGTEEIVVPQSAGFVAGLHETFTLTETGGQQEGLEVRLSPAGFYRLFGIPMSEFANRTVTLEDIAPAWHGNLVDRLRDATDWASQFRVAEQCLAPASPDHAPDARVLWAWWQLRQSQGQTPVSGLVTELGWSHKRLVARFREHLGLTPKQCARLIRFHHVVQHPAFGPGADWCALAQACGYYDQSHLIRDVRAFAGDTPEGLVRRRLTESAGFAASMDDQR